MINSILIFVFDLSRYDGTTIDTITHPQYCHAIGAMASSLGRPVAVEGSTPGMEIMDMTTFEWSQGAAQQFHRLYSFTQSNESETQNLI